MPLAFLNALAREGVSIGAIVGRVAGAGLESRLLPAFDGFITVSEAVRKQLIGWLPEDHVFTVGNGLHGRFGLRNTLSERGKAALYVGRLDEGKGALDLLRVWKEVVRAIPEAGLEVVGDGSLRRRLDEEASRPDYANRVHLHGFLPETVLRDLRHASRLFLTLSRTEGFGMALAEALSDGLPVVAWDIPPLREIWGECRAVSLCPVGDIEAATRAVVDILQAPPARWELLSQEASRYVQGFSWDEVAAKELRVLVDLIERG
jgi:glycosyltransferase involved in cell wall biosynthesis